MNLKLIGTILGALAFLVIIGALGWKVVGKTEGYRADEQTFQSFEPHYFIGGCASYKVMREKKNALPKVTNSTSRSR